jgi:hypothetical protein
MYNYSSNNKQCECSVLLEHYKVTAKLFMSYRSDQRNQQSVQKNPEAGLWRLESTQYYTNSVGSEPFGVDAARVLLGPPSQEKNN